MIKKPLNGPPARIIVWLRNDLRVHDNYALNFAMNYMGKKEVLVVYCFDPRYYDAK